MSNQASAASDEKPKEPKLPWYMSGPGGAKPIRVRQLRTPKGHEMELPKKSAANVVADESLRRDPEGKPMPAQTNVDRYNIYLLPWLHVFAVLHYRPSVMEPSAPPVLIPVAWGQCELAE